MFHHDSPAFSVSGHLWVDAIAAHVTFQPVKPSYTQQPGIKISKNWQLVSMEEG